MRVLVSMLLLIGFAVGAAEPTQTFTDDLGRKVEVPLHPKRIVSLHDLDITWRTARRQPRPHAPGRQPFSARQRHADGGGFR